jgi:hypothetical protein
MAYSLRKKNKRTRSNKRKTIRRLIRKTMRKLGCKLKSRKLKKSKTISKNKKGGDLNNFETEEIKNKLTQLQFSPNEVNELVSKMNPNAYALHKRSRGEVNPLIYNDLISILDRYIQKIKNEPETKTKVQLLVKNNIYEQSQRLSDMEPDTDDEHDY